MALILAAAAYFAWQQLTPKPPPPPPPIPPALLREPAPLIGLAEQGKIIKSSDDQDPGVRWEAIAFLDKMKVPAAFDVMFDKLQHDTDTELRIKIMNLLGERGAAKADIAQAQGADPLNPAVVAAARARDQRAKEIARHLVSATEDPMPEIRLAALRALDALGDFSIASAIAGCIKDEDEDVRLQALKTLNDLQDKKTSMIEAERKRREELRRQAEKAKDD